MDWAKATARGDKKHLSFGIWCDLDQMYVDSIATPFKACSVPDTLQKPENSSLTHWLAMMP